MENADLALLGRARNIVTTDETTIVDGAGDSLQLHFLRNVLAQVPKVSAEMVAAAICTIFAQPQADMVRDQLGVIAAMLGLAVDHVVRVLVRPRHADEFGVERGIRRLHHHGHRAVASPAGAAAGGEPSAC